MLTRKYGINYMDMHYKIGVTCVFNIFGWDINNQTHQFHNSADGVINVRASG